MSMHSSWAGMAQGPQSAELPRGVTAGSYATYPEAQAAVDLLADQGFAVEHVSIIGKDLKLVERVVAPLSYPKVALSSAVSGMWFGLLIGILLSLFGSSGDQSGFPLFSSVLLGAAFWMLFGVVGYAMRRGKHDFASTYAVVASGYEVIIDREAAAEAQRLLHQHSPDGHRQDTRGYVQQHPNHGEGNRHDLPDGRPEYGVRVPPSGGDDYQV
ncbi:MAG: general stress protein [Actinomycetes bacterium]